MTVYNQSSVVYYPGYSQVQVHPNLLVNTILSVTNAYHAVITTELDHGYVPGMVVRFLVPTMFGMQQLNNAIAQVLSVTSNTLTINLNTLEFGVFAYPMSLPNAYTRPSVFPNNSGPYLPPKPLPEGNQTSFEGVIYNNGTFGDPVNGNSIS